MSQYKDIDYCPHCNKETEQVFKSADHERDSSNDTQTCTVCGYWKSGYTDNWIAPSDETE